MAFNTFELNLFKHDAKGAKQMVIAYVGDNHDDIDAHVNDHLRDLKRFTDKYPSDSVLFHLMGDYGDFCSTGERAMIRNSKLHDTTIKTLDDVAENRLMKRIKQFAFMKGRVIGVHNGNHDWKFSTGRFNGLYASEVLAKELDAKHIGYVAYTVIKLVNLLGSKSSYRMDIQIASCHGKGGGTRIGAGFNKVEDMCYIFEGADIYVQGHNHQLGGIPSARLVVQYNIRTHKLDLKQKILSFVRSGSSMRGYIPGESTYVSDSLMKPCALGFPFSILEFSRVSCNGERTLVKSIKTLA